MGVYFTPSREEAQLHLVCGALWLLSALCWGWVGAKCTVHVCFGDTSVRERRVFVLVCCWERKCMSVFVQVHQMHLCEQDRKTKVCPSFPSDLPISLAHLCGSGSSIHSQFSLSVGGRQTALWHAQSTDLYLRSHTVSFMLFFRADLWAAHPGLSHWQRPSFVCLNRSHTTVLPFILSSHNPQKDHSWTVCSKLSFSKVCSDDAFVYLRWISTTYPKRVDAKCLYSSAIPSVSNSLSGRVSTKALCLQDQHTQVNSSLCNPQTRPVVGSHLCNTQPCPA